MLCEWVHHSSRTPGWRPRSELRKKPFSKLYLIWEKNNQTSDIYRGVLFIICYVIVLLVVLHGKQAIVLPYKVSVPVCGNPILFCKLRCNRWSNILLPEGVLSELPEWRNGISNPSSANCWTNVVETLVPRNTCKTWHDLESWTVRSCSKQQGSTTGQTVSTARPNFSHLPFVQIHCVGLVLLETCTFFFNLCMYPGYVYSCAWTGPCT